MADYVVGSPALFNEDATFFGDVNAFSNISVNGNITGNTIRVSSGNSNQFLKADGTLDSNTYLTATTLVLPSAEFLAGTTLLFYQATAPTGYTKQTTHDNKAMRVVSGTGGGSGGSSAFTSVFASKTPTGTVSGSNSSGSVSNTTLTEAQIPSHSHDMTNYHTGQSLDGANSGGAVGVYNFTSLATQATSNTGGSTSHTHGFTNPTWSGSFSGTAIDFAVQYIDVIICSKN